MALETLEGVEEIGGFPVLHIDKELSIDEYMEIEDKPYIQVNHKFNTINFKIQDGPIKEKGVSGCQVQTIIETAKVILENLNEKFPSQYNSHALDGLGYAIFSMKRRTRDREMRGVEGENKA